MSYAANALSRTSWMRLRNELPKLLGTIQNFHEKNTGPTTGAIILRFWTEKEAVKFAPKTTEESESEE